MRYVKPGIPVKGVLSEEEKSHLDPYYAPHRVPETAPERDWVDEFNSKSVEKERLEHEVVMDEFIKRIRGCSTDLVGMAEVLAAMLDYLRYEDKL